MRLAVHRVLAAVAAICMAMTLVSAAAGPVVAAVGDEVLSWGRNQYGQLGNGTTNAAGEPVPGLVSLPTGTSVTTVSGGYGFSVALTSTGEVLAWGTNDEGQLGDGSFASSTVPVNVDLPAGTTITAIAAGDDHILALTSTGQMLAWGYNEWGQLGDGTTTDRGAPVLIDLPAGMTVTAISAGAGHSLALTATGEVLAWGDNDFGQLGDGTTTTRTEPVLVDLPAGSTVTTIAGGDDHSLALTSTGELLAWGSNGSGQLGDGTTTTRTGPVVVHLPAGSTVTGIVGASGFQSFALTSTGELLAWGDNSYGQLGDGTTTRRTEPVLVHLPAGTAVTAVASGDDHTVTLTSTGQVLAWGYNRYGQVGDGTTTNRTEPVEVQQPDGLAVVAIGVGSYHSLAIAQSPQTTTTLTAEPEQAQTGDPVTFTATVTCTAGTPTGTVTFTANGQEIGTATLENGVATLITDALPEGEHTVVAHYPGDSSCPASSSEPVVVTITAAGSAQIAKTLTSGSFMDYLYNSDGQLPRFHGTVTCELPTGEVFTEDFTVRVNESFDMQRLPVDATCTVTEDPALTDQDFDTGNFVPVEIGEWEWARPVFVVDDVVTDEFTTSAGAQARIEITNTLLGDFRINKFSNVDGIPSPFKIIYSARTPTGERQDGYVLTDDETVADPAPNTWQGVVYAQANEMEARPFDPVTGKPLLFPAGTEFVFDEVFAEPPPGYVFAGMDYWPQPVVIGPNEPHAIVEMHNTFVQEPVLARFRKEVTGDAAHLVQPNTEFLLDYAVNGAPRGTVSVTPGGEYPLYGEFLVGDRITVSEQPPPDIPGVSWGEPVFEPSDDFVVEQPGEVIVTVRNEARLADATFSIRKKLEGDGAQLVPGEATFTVDYTVNGVPADTPLTITADGTVLTGPLLKHDDVIVFSEVTPPAVPGVAWGSVSIDPPSLTLDSGASPVLVTVTNEAVARTGSFQIKKALAGEGAHLVPPDTVFTVEGTVSGLPPGYPVPPLPTTITADGSVVNGPEGLPEGAVVTYTEVTPPPEIAGLVWDGFEISPESVTIVPGETPLITVTNTYSLSPASFQIRKMVTGEAADQVPDATEFTVDYWVNGAPADTPLTITADGTIVNGPTLNHGDTITFAETTQPDLPGVAWGPVTIEPAEITLDATADPRLVTVTNEATRADAGFGIRKMVMGEAADRVPDTTVFTVDYWVNGVPADTPLTITADGTIVNGPVLNHGDVLTFAEATPPDVPGVTWGPVTIEPVEITLDATADPRLVTVTNVANSAPATFQIRKVVTGPGAGLVPGTTEFTVDYWVNGAPADTPLTITADGTMVNGPTLSHGDVITFAERAPPHIAGVAWDVPVEIDPVEVTLDAEVPTPVVTVTNTADMATATFQVRKELTGDGASAVPPDTEFTVGYSVNGTPAAEPLVVPADGTVVDGPPLTHGDVVTFAEVTPPDVPGVIWGRVTIDPPELTIDTEAAQPQLVTVTNEVTLAEATFQVRKAVTGNGASAVPPDTTFTVEYSVNGTPAAEPLTIRADGTTVDSPPLRHGDEIVVGEVAMPAVPGIVWGTPVIEPSQFTLVAGAPVLVTVTNEANLADTTFRIRKELTGNGADLVPPDTEFTVAYAVNGTPATAPLTIRADGTVVDGPPLSHGDVVVFTEVTPPTVAGVAWGPSVIDPETLTLDAEADPVLVTVSNEAVERTGTFQIQKDVTGSGARLVPDDTEFTVNYAVNGEPAATPLTLLADGTIVNGPDRLIEGDVVTFTEATPAEIPGVEWGGVTISPQTITVDPDVETPLVVVTNTYTVKAASFQIRKKVTGDGASAVPPDTEFTVIYSVDGVPAATPLTILADGTAVDGPALNHGDVVTFAERPPPNVPGVEWVATTIDPAEITLDAETAAPVVTVTNEARLSASELTVVKLDAVSKVPLAGATFDLVLDDGDQMYDATTDEVIGSCDTAGEDGWCTIGELGFGTYFWVETAAPTGYGLPTNPVSPAIVIDATNAGTVIPPTNFHDPRLPTTLTVRKIDADTNKPLAGGVFELRRYEGDELVGECTTGANGECSIGDLDFGDYYWYETAAPPGYVLPDDRTSPVITVDASNAGQTHSTTITNKAVEPTPPPAPPEPGDGAADGTSGDTGDTSDDKGDLSDTGASIAIPAAAGVTLLLVGGALLLTVRRRRHN